MPKTITFCLALTAAIWTSLSVAHGPAQVTEDNVPGRAIVFPDTADRLTLSVDLHTHSVFSDGHVWPRIRVGEALKDGLDAMAITEHLEWQPHLADIPHEDRNRAFEEAQASLPEGTDLILIAGSEITRSEPIGHMNAVFIEDANALLKRGVPSEPYDMRDYYTQSGEWPVEEALDAAAEQGAFVFWNHAWWQRPDQMAVTADFHRKAIRQKKLQGIEIANGDTYSPEAFQIALDHDLTLVGVSDVHELIDWDYPPHEGRHRPVNLVFAEERTAESIRQALFEGRAVVWYRNLLLGRERDLGPLLVASLQADASWDGESSVLKLVLTNRSDAAFVLDNETGYTLTSAAQTIDVPPHSSNNYRFRLEDREEQVELRFTVRNALIRPDAHAQINFTVQP